MKTSHDCLLRSLILNSSADRQRLKVRIINVESGLKDAVGFSNGSKRFVNISGDICHFPSTFLQRPLFSWFQEASENIFILKMRTLDPKSCG